MTTVFDFSIFKYCPPATVVVDGERLSIIWADAKDPEAADLVEFFERKNPLAAHPPFSDVLEGKIDKSDYFWPLMEVSDRQYAVSPPPKIRCPWCRRCCGHFVFCPELNDDHSVTMPFGMHRGTLVRNVPRDYLEWIVDNAIELPDEIMEEVHKTLTYINSEHNTI